MRAANQSARMPEERDDDRPARLTGEANAAATERGQVESGSRIARPECVAQASVLNVVANGIIIENSLEQDAVTVMFLARAGTWGSCRRSARAISEMHGSNMGRRTLTGDPDEIVTPCSTTELTRMEG